MDIVITAIKELLESSVSQTSSPLNDIKRVFYWDPITIPQSNLPALCIQPIWTEYILRGSRYDQKKHTIEIRLIYNTKSYFSENPAIDKVEAVEDAIKKVEEWNLSHETANYTVCGTIQKNTTLPYTYSSTIKNACELARVKSVNYTFSDARGFPTYEVITIVEADVIWNR